jgi:hypothetical protein
MTESMISDAIYNGVPRVLAFPFAFDTPDLLTGAAVYTPTIGAVLLDAWVEIDIAWDGTTPLCDVGTLDVDSGVGWFYEAGGRRQSEGPRVINAARVDAPAMIGGTLFAEQSLGR